MCVYMYIHVLTLCGHTVALSPAPIHSLAVLHTEIQGSYEYVQCIAESIYIATCVLALCAVFPDNFLL